MAKPGNPVRIASLSEERSDTKFTRPNSVGGGSAKKINCRCDILH